MLFLLINAIMDIYPTEICLLRGLYTFMHAATVIICNTNIMVYVTHYYRDTCKYRYYLSSLFLLPWFLSSA